MRNVNFGTRKITKSTLTLTSGSTSGLTPTLGIKHGLLRLAVVLLMLPVTMMAWAGGGSTYYARAGVAVKTGSGTVYVDTKSDFSTANNTSTSTTVTYSANISSTNQNTEVGPFYIKAVPAIDWRFDSWEFSGWSTNPSTSTASTNGKIKASETGQSQTTHTAKATFKQISIASVSPATVTLTPTDARTSCSDYTGSVAFTTTNDNAAAQIGTPAFTNSGSGTWTATKDWAAGKSTVTYTFKGNGYYGGSGTSSGSRSNSATLTLPTAGGTSSKSVTFTANFPSLILSDATENNKAYPINPTTDGTGTVVFPVKYCDGAFDFTATITGASGGTFTPGTISFTQTDAATGSGNITVPFTFNAGGAEGDFSATLTLTPQANTGGTAKSVTITAYAEAEATNDVSVTTSAGVETEYATWAQGLAAANASAGCTLTLLRNIDLTSTYGITSTQGITQTFTLDLNGKTLSGAINGSILNPNTKNKTLTIKDSKTGGKIQNITPDFNGVTYGINLSAACTLNLESGTIYAENQKQYSYGTSTVGGTASNATSVEVRAVRLVAGAKFNMSGGKVEAHGTRQVRAIYQESSAANSTEVNITGGEVYAEAPSYVYGIVAFGKVNLSGDAKVNVKINDELVNGNATYQSSKFDSYTMHRYGYGIYMTATANKTASSCYFGTLNMNGGTVNVENVNKTVNGTTLQTEHTYGIYMGIASTGMGNSNGAATDGTNTQKASAIGSIENATINVTHEGVQVYGIDVLGCYNSFNKTTTPFTIKNSTINVTGWQTVYGVLSDVSIDWSNSLTTFTGTGRCSAGNVELTNTTINATTTGGTGAYCAWASATYGTVADAKANTGAQSTGNATYKGEYAVAATLTINSGNYTANAATSSAYAVGSSDRAKTIRNIRGSIISRDASTDSNGSLGGNAEAYPELYIHGGTFKAKTLSAGTARAVKSGGTTVIDGGTFEADAATSSSVAIAVHSGKTIVTGVTMTAYANTDANAVYVPATVSEYSLFDFAGEVELNNCVATVVTRTAENARGVYVNSATRTYTLAQFNTAKEANNSTYKTYGDYWQVGTKAISGKATINGGSYNVKSATKNAYGVLLTTNALSTDGTAKADGEIIARNATFIVQTLNGATAYGIQAGGKATVDGCNLTVTASTSDARGVYSLDEKTIVKNSTITTTTSTSGSYGTIGSAVVASNGVERVADFELSGNTISSTAGTETAYAIYMTGASGGPYATDYFTGSMALAATAVVNSGTYSANASTKTAYAAGVADPLLKNEATATPSIVINDGKFKGTASATGADVSLAGEPGYFVLNGGYYVKDENLDKKLGEGMNKVAVKSGTPEYAEGYRWRVTDNMTGEYVCKIKENSTSYASLEEALQVVNAAPTQTWTIIMIANYTLAKGDYVLPAKTTLLIPYYSTQTAINGATPTYTSPVKNVEKYEAPSPIYKLTFANGVNMSVYGKIEASAVTYLSNQGLTTHGTGVVSGKYGWLYLNEGSHIDLESGAALYAWGFVTGKGEINAKNGSAVYEDFQMGDWRGGTEESNVKGNKNGLDNKGVFLITHYYYQNIECPITYRAGAQGFAHGGTYMYNNSFFEIEEAVPTQEAVKMIGTSGAMFLMDPATAGEDTWVRKEYDTETDYVNWTMNSGAKLGSVSLKMDLPIVGKMDVSSSDYVLPITSNFNIVANDGEIQITNHACFLPGSKLTIKKEGTLTIPTGQRVFFYDQDDWLSYSGYWFNPGYSPSWKVNPRVATIGDKTKVKMPDAEVLVEGLLNVKGAIYTTAGGANIHSTRENAGKVKFGATLPAATAATGETTGNSTLYQWKAGGPKYDGKALNPAWLKNEDGLYSKPTSANTSSGDTWVYMQSLTSDTYEWTKASEDGCFTIRSTGDTKTYVHPSDWVAVGSVNANHAYPSEDGTRMFVNAEAASTSASCKWWDVNKTPEVIDGTTYYVANNENFPNFGTYYYWDNTTSYWKPKKITVTWQNEDGTKITNGTYGDLYSFNTSPQFYGTNPKKTPTAIEKYDWIGWRDAEGNIYDKNTTLPRATSDVTYTAYFNTTKYQYTITFKNDDNSDLWAGLVDAGTTGEELQALFEQKYNEKTGNTVPQKAPTVDKVFTFTGWNTTLATVNAAATYTAQYSHSTRQYHVTFYNYDAVSVLYEADVDYNTRPTYSGVTPFRANTSAFSYDWTGWQQGSNTYGTSATLPVVTGNISYIATFAQTELKYQVFFKRQDGSIIDAPFFTYEQTPSAFPANPTMASTVSTDYTFREWSPATLVPVTEDGKVYTALFDESPRQYTAHFVNYNATSLGADKTIDYNTVPTYIGPTPTKPNDARNSYVFSGWAWAAGEGWEAGSVGVGEALPAIKGEITFTAQFNAVLLQFNVIYQREDGTIIDSQKKKWGESTAFPTTFAGATSGLNYEDESYSYTFDHWNPATVVTPVTADATYTAYYNQSVKTYSITAVGISPADYGSVSPTSLSGIPGGSTVTVDGNKLTVNGSTITATPAAADAQYTYTFDHWNNVPATVTGHVSTIEAVFTRTVNTYTVTWKNADGTVLETDENVEYGTTPTYDGETPTKVADVDGVYTFETWTPAVGAVAGETTYTATYTSVPSVASVTVNEVTTYYATIAEAITFANSKTNAVVTILQDATVTSEIAITAAMTIDLNGKTVSSTLATATGVFKINASGKIVTINGAGTINHTAAAGVYGIYAGSGTLNMTDVTVIADGSTTVRGIYVRGASGSTATVTLTDVTVEARTSAANNIAVYTYAYTDVTINSGTYTTTTGTGTRYAVYARSETGSKITIKGGKFNGTDKDVYKNGDNATISISGGYYVHQNNIGVYCVANHYVFDLPSSETPYKYEVAEGYTLTFDANGHGTAPATQTIKKGGKATEPAAPTATGYTFGGWYKEEACTNAWNFTSETVTAAQTLHAKWTPISYNIVYKDKGNNSFSGENAASLPTTHTYGTQTVLVDAEKEGYTFHGWYLNSDCTGSRVYSLEADAYTADITLYASWTMNTFTINISASPAEYGSVSHTRLTGIANSSAVTTDLNTFRVSVYTVTATPIARTNEYTWYFDHWEGLTETVTGNLNVVAVFGRYQNTYNVTYNNPATGEQVTLRDITYSEIPTPTDYDTEDNHFTFTGWQIDDRDYTAEYTSQELLYGEEYRLDIAEWSGNGSGQSITLNMNGYSLPANKTQWSVRVGNGAKLKNATATRVWNADRTLTVSDLTLTAGSTLLIKVYDGVGDDSECVSRLRYQVPIVVNSYATLSALSPQTTSDVLVRGGATLTVSSNATLRTVLVDAGSALKIESGATLTVTDRLVLRTRTTKDVDFRAPELINNGTLTLSPGAKFYYSRIVADKLQLYPIGFPFEVTLSQVILSNSNMVTATSGTHFALQYYDGASRAANGMGGNWKLYTGVTMEAKKGYLLLSTSAYYREFLFPMTYSKSPEASVNVTAHPSENVTDAGWNMIVTPFTATASTTSDNPSQKIKIAKLYEDNVNYYQDVAANLEPATPFYYQHAGTENGELSFETPNKILRRSPRLNYTDRSVEEEWVRLSYGKTSQDSRRDVANIFAHPDRFSEEYESGADVVKMSTTGERALLYSSLACGELAFAAVPDSLLEQGLPLTVNSPSEGEYRFELEPTDNLSRLESLYLYDDTYGSMIDLLESDYTTDVAAGVSRGRFRLFGVYRAPQIATDIEVVNGGNGDADANGGNGDSAKPRKIMRDGYIYILMPNGDVYSVIGRKME